ncbi:hypothetical protein QE393_002530 [Pseudomonas sp. SORGH_AS 211]|uniref:DUF4442 domain-containing protein n=1 Tax=Pseudomonas sp. SORGH_AS_0211 TaxID=3041796 RepID=UPI0028572E4A|nr:DUF4442 domain-containing protein [Pseudomonas sp. SORGH_AS_0211]MDR6179270.1 hypothetical protein [Pseudomonas sp. SORGH_AS_0211]
MNRLLFNLFVWTKVPIAKIAGLRLRHLDDAGCQMQVTHGWLNQNPFRSMFWAVEGMAAEFSTGILADRHIRRSGSRYAMLVVAMSATFSKKAVGTLVFRCDQGAAIAAALVQARATGEPQTLSLRSVGTDESGDQVAEFCFTWSFKARMPVATSL